jgi:hypothetical protein
VDVGEVKNDPEDDRKELGSRFEVAMLEAGMELLPFDDDDKD